MSGKNVGLLKYLIQQDYCHLLTKERKTKKCREEGKGECRGVAEEQEVREERKEEC